jgi:hypothetical protein
MYGHDIAIPRGERGKTLKYYKNPMEKNCEIHTIWNRQLIPIID